MSKVKNRRPLSKISTMHYCKLVFRSGLLLAAAALYISNRINNTGSLFGGYESNPLLLNVIWLVFVVEMLLRFFPSSMESMGCQKQFKRNYRPTGADLSLGRLRSARSTFAVAAAWFALNGAIGALYFAHIIDEGILLLISLAYSVCDMICILFFCPFQTWFMKNKCCGSCRIYNWDFAMMFTPLVFIKNAYAWTLLGLALLLLAQWEYLIHRYPERFSEATNCSLSCGRCQEKLCHHKKQLRNFLRKNRAYLNLKGNQVMPGKKR